MLRTVFLSHSCNEDPAGLAIDDPRRARLERARSVRTAIIEKLSGTFDVWLDSQRLRSGDPWRLEIFRNLYRCSAGVVLLDEDAFSSDWVLQEATILNFRRCLNPAVVLIPVLLDEEISSRFDQGGWKPLALRELQALKASPSEVADEVFSRLTTLVSTIATDMGDLGLDAWLALLSGRLRKVATDYPDLLTAACSLLGISSEDWAADGASAVGLFAQALLSAPPHVVAAVANRYLKSATNDEDRKVLRRLLGPLWVDLAAAATTAGVLRRAEGERRAFLNTADQDVATEYVDRAVNCADSVLFVRSHDVFGEDENELFDALEQLVIDATPIKDDPSTEMFVWWLEAFMRRVVLLVPAVLGAQALRRLLDRLSDRFPGIAVLVLDRTGMWKAAELEVLAAIGVEPPLDTATLIKASVYRGELDLFVGR